MAETVPSWLKTFLEAQEAARLKQEETIANLLSTLASNAIQPVTSHHESSPEQIQTLQSTQAKLPAPARPPLLDTSTTYSKFRSWRTIWNDYRMMSKLEKLPLNIQKAELRSCLTEEMRIHIKCAIDIHDEDDSTVEDILDKIQVHLRKKRNVALDRVAFEQRKQEIGENFDDFYVCIKQLAEEADICETCKEQRITTKIMASINDQEMKQKLLAMTPFPYLQSVVDLCRSQETAIKDASILNGETDIGRVKKTNYQKYKNENSKNTRSMDNVKCHRCGNERHPFFKCPARTDQCRSCDKIGHWAKFCQNKK